MRETVTINEVIEILNEAIKLDTPAIAALIANRVPCNEGLADHPSIQCGSQHGGYWVGMLGVINGLFGVDEHGWGAIASVFEEDGSPDGRRLVRFGRNKLVFEESQQARHID